jgi:hypothetical protein
MASSADFFGDRLFPEEIHASGFDDTKFFTTHIAFARLPDTHLLGIMPRAFAPTLTTPAFNRSRLE